MYFYRVVKSKLGGFYVQKETIYEYVGTVFETTNKNEAIGVLKYFTGKYSDSINFAYPENIKEISK